MDNEGKEYTIPLTSNPDLSELDEQSARRIRNIEKEIQDEEGIDPDDDLGEVQGLEEEQKEEDEDEPIEIKEKVGSGVNLDIGGEEEENERIEEREFEGNGEEGVEEAEENDEEGKDGAEEAEGENEDETDTGEAILSEEKIIIQDSLQEDEYVAICGPGGLLLVDPASDPWPSELRLYLLDTMYDVPLPEHAECLLVDALMRLHNLNFEVEQPPNVEYMSPSGRAPFLKSGRFLVSELAQIMRVFSMKGLTLSGDLSEEDDSNHKDLWFLVHKTLSTVELEVSWLHTATRKQLTEPKLLQKYPWPLSRLVWAKKKRQAEQALALAYGCGDDKTGLQFSLDRVYKQVDDICSTLETQLGESPYLFGEKPTELDVLVYSHLYLMVTTPAPIGESNTLYLMIQEHPMVLALVERLDDEIFGRQLDIFL